MSSSVPGMRRLFARRVLLVLFLGTFLSSCAKQEPASEGLYEAVDELYAAVIAGTSHFEVIAQIDHSRLAAKEGEVMPPARVIIFSDPTVNTPILQQEPLAGLDLPFRVLAYAQGDSPAVVFTTADYLMRRHGLSDGPALQRYEEEVLSVVASVPSEVIVEFDTTSLGKSQGIVTLNSSYDFDQTIERLKAAIMVEGDTVWFGEIDYQEEAATLGVELPRLTLLLFGAPGPGAKAMAEFPRMGLDAFCQKLLVYQSPGEQVTVFFNDMRTFAELHHGDSALPHRVITHRMGGTLGGAVEE